MPTRLIIADDHPLLINGLTSVLQEMDNVQVIGAVANGRQLIDKLRNTAADIVLLDLNMLPPDGIATLKILSREFPSLKVIVFTNYHQPRLITEIKNLGAKGYVLKTSNSIILKEAISEVAAGHTYFPDETNASSVPSQFLDDFIKTYQLTKREVEIIRMIGSGFTTKQIGEKLFVSEFTVSAHRRNISRKLNIHTPVGLVNFAREHGLV